MLEKYYSLDECSDVKLVIEKLDSLRDDGKISYKKVESDVLRIKDTGLSLKETKDFIKFLDEFDVIAYIDYEPSGYDEEDDDFDDFEDEYDEEDEY